MTGSKGALEGQKEGMIECGPSPAGRKGRGASGGGRGSSRGGSACWGWGWCSYWKLGGAVSNLHNMTGIHFIFGI